MTSLDGRRSSFLRFSKDIYSKEARLTSPPNRASNNGQSYMDRYRNLGMTFEKSTCHRLLKLIRFNDLGEVRLPNL